MKRRKPGSIEKAKGSRTAALQDEKHKAVLLPCFALVLIDVGAVGGEESRRDQRERERAFILEGNRAPVAKATHARIRKNSVCLRAICLRASKCD